MSDWASDRSVSPLPTELSKTAGLYSSLDLQIYSSMLIRIKRIIIMILDQSVLSQPVLYSIILIKLQVVAVDFGLINTLNNCEMSDMATVEHPTGYTATSAVVPHAPTHKSKSEILWALI